MSNTSVDDSLALSRRVWGFNHDLDWPRLLERAHELGAAPAGDAYAAFEGTVDGTAAFGGSARGVELAPIVPVLARDLEVLERDAATGSMSWSWMALADQVGVFAAMGAPGGEALLARLPACLPSIQTARDIDLVKYHWDRGLAALLLDIPAIYRPISGHDFRQAPDFTPGALPEFNIQGLLAHLAGAVEHGAALADCEPAWHQALANFRVLERANMLGTPSLVWIASILHHRVARQPLATAADYLRDSVARVADGDG